MRAIVSLADECRFALGYARPEGTSKLEVKVRASESEEKTE